MVDLDSSLHLGLHETIFIFLPKPSAYLLFFHLSSIILCIYYLLYVGYSFFALFDPLKLVLPAGKWQVVDCLSLASTVDGLNLHFEGPCGYPVAPLLLLQFFSSVIDSSSCCTP